MARRFDLRDLLDPKAKIRSKRTPRTRADRLAMAPAPPVSIQARYTKALFALLDGFRLVALETLEPLLRSDATLLIKVDATDYTPFFDRLRIRLGTLTEEPKLIEIVESVARDMGAKNASDISRILGVDLSRDTSLETVIQGFIRENVSLIRSVMGNQLGEMESLVREAQSGGIRVEALRNRILESFDVSKSRASLIARDQTLKVNADLTRERHTRLGITEYIWSTSNDERVRGRPGGKWENTESNHWRLDGQRFSWSNPPVTNQVTGERNHPGEDYQCRCVALPITEDLLSDL